MGDINLGYDTHGHIPPARMDDQFNMQPMPPNSGSDTAQPHIPHQFYRSLNPPRRLQSGDTSLTHRDLMEIHRNHVHRRLTGRSNPRCGKRRMWISVLLLVIIRLIEHRQLLKDPQLPRNFASTLSFIRHYPRAVYFLRGGRKIPTINPLNEPPKLEENHKVYTFHPIYLSNLNEMGPLSLWWRLPISTFANS